MPSTPGKIFRLGERIGTGGFSHVFKALDVSTGNACAVKKSRASTRIKRPILEYEARILKSLQGHPAIPKLIAYGRFDHFEYLAMELLGRSLSDAQTKLPVSNVAHIAVQMLSVLKHIHAAGIVHRDIKPQNILARDNQNFSHICLIDFGLARPCISTEPRTQDPVIERMNPVGTLTWASINAYRGVDLNPRDDLESLAYVLLYLIRGDLPWGGLCEHGTSVGRIAQIREKMPRWNGARLSRGYPPVFGELVDYARGLDFIEAIDYERFRALFEQLASSEPLSDHVQKSATDDVHPVPGVCPVKTGQLVLVQIDAPASIEGYSMQENNTSYWANPALYLDYWEMPHRPSIVISTIFDERVKRHCIKVVPLYVSSQPGENAVPLSAPVLALDQSSRSASDVFCYAFLRPFEFYCFPDQTPLTPQCTISQEGVRFLCAEFDQKSPVVWSQIEDPNPDVRYDNRIRSQNVKFYANVAPLQESTLLTRMDPPDTSIEWSGCRGWFDDCVKIARRRGWDDGFHWTGDVETIQQDSELDNSYYGDDVSLWDYRQRERDSELHLENEDFINLDRIIEVV
ncbi:kinase-like domain-containing protein [Crassisporium funariophilum]|nr:kinase-like domain-containing protein [Crassisporium funariophilum]